MRAKELIPLLADVLGIPAETAVVIDRSLADAGFRTKVKGRNPPPMSRREAIHFVIAAMTARVATRAGEDVDHWTSFATSKKGGANLVDYLLNLTATAADWSDEDCYRLRLEIDLSHQLVLIKFGEEGAFTEQDEVFVDPRSTYDEMPDIAAAIHRVSFVQGFVFRVIAEKADA